VAVIFIGGGNWSKPPTCRKSMTNFITYVIWGTPGHEQGSNSQL